MPPFHSLIFCLLALFSGVAPTASAAVIAVANQSFETPATAAGTFVTSATVAPVGWSIYGSLSGTRQVGVLNPNTTTLYTDPVPNGNNVGVVFLLNSTGAEAGLQQTLGDNLQPLTTYVLTIEVGNIANDSNPPHNSFNFTGFPGYRIELLAGAAVVASDNNTLLPGEGRFLTSTLQFSTGLTHPNQNQPLGIRLINLNGAGIEVNFDDVHLDFFPVPEPATPANLLAVFLLVCGRISRGGRTAP